MDVDAKMIHQPFTSSASVQQLSERLRAVRNASGQSRCSFSPPIPPPALSMKVPMKQSAVQQISRLTPPPHKHSGERSAAASEVVGARHHGASQSLVLGCTRCIGASRFRLSPPVVFSAGPGSRQLSRHRSAVSMVFAAAHPLPGATISPAGLSSMALCCVWLRIQTVCGCGVKEMACRPH